MDTDARPSLGIIFNFSKDWFGGIYYIINIIRTLDFLDDNDKPVIYLFYNIKLKNFLEEIKYPYLEKIEWPFLSVPKGFIKSFSSRRNEFIQPILNKFDLDGLYPVWDWPMKNKSQKTKVLAWSADLQQKYYPHFFSWKQRLLRETRLRFILANADGLVVSSHAVANDYRKFFKIRKGFPLHIYNFISIINESPEETEIEELKKKYKIGDRYFIVSNQFLEHKNHKVVLEAAGILKTKGVQIEIAVTGKLPASKGADFLSQLYSLLDNLELRDQVKFLGVVPRSEQLALMKFSTGVIQPSLFEGWSTVIEDARSLQVPVVAASLPVNLEQLGGSGNYFSPNDASELSSILERFPARNFNDKFYEEYPVRTRKAAYEFISLFKNSGNNKF